MSQDNRKTAALGYLFNKVAHLQACIFIKKALQLFKNTYFEKRLQTAASKQKWQTLKTLHSYFT